MLDHVYRCKVKHYLEGLNKFEPHESERGGKTCKTLKKSLTFPKTFFKNNHAHPFYLRKWVTLTKPMLMQSSWDKPTPNAKGLFPKCFKEKVLIKNKITYLYIIDTKFNN